MCGGEKEESGEKILVSGDPVVDHDFILTSYRVRYFRGRVSYFNQSVARKHCFLTSD